MFRFSIRDVLWLTVVVAVAAKLGSDIRSLNQKLDRELQRPNYPNLILNGQTVGLQPGERFEVRQWNDARRTLYVAKLEDDAESDDE